MVVDLGFGFVGGDFRFGDGDVRFGDGDVGFVGGDVRFLGWVSHAHDGKPGVCGGGVVRK